MDGIAIQQCAARQEGGCKEQHSLGNEDGAVLLGHGRHDLHQLRRLGQRVLIRSLHGGQTLSNEHHVWALQEGIVWQEASHPV